MKSVQVVARGRAEFIDAPRPQARPGFAVVRTSHLSLCGSDIRMLHHAADDCYPFPPGTSGHEMVGVIEEIVDGNQSLARGDRVLALAPGHQAMCEYYLAPLDLILPLPPGKPIEVLLQAQQLGTVLYAAKRLPNLLGRSAVVIGQGSAGLWFNWLLRRLGAAAVVALDLDANRLARSVEFGATHTIRHAEGQTVAAVRECLQGDLADVVIEAAGEIEAINLAIELVKKFGDILYFGYPRGQSLLLNFEHLFHQCCRATTIVGATEEPQQLSSRMAIDLIDQQPELAASLITHRLKFDEVMEAYEMHRRRADGCLKIVIEMPGAVA